MKELTTYTCINCNLPINECNCSWTSVRELYQMFSKLSDRIVKLENHLSKLNEDFNNKLDVDYKKWCQYFSEVHPQKKPHKCPVCNSEGRVKLDTPLKKDNVTYFSISCVSCKEQGIVWR